MIPKKLKKGDHIRVISPAITLAAIPEETQNMATARWQDMGFSVSFSQHAREQNRFRSSSVASRVSDLHEAFSDPAVDGILTTLGGYNSNQILHHLDYELIRANPKVICGFSDITALSNAIYAKTGLVTYSGPHYSTLGMKKGVEYTIDMFKQCVMQEGVYRVEQADTWSDDMWFRDQEERTFIENEGYLLINEGEAGGTILGGNLSTFPLLHGTPFMPSLKESILLLEDDDEAHLAAFDRLLQSIMHQPDFESVRGIVIGQFQKGSNVEEDALVETVKNKPELNHIPVIARASFGHTTPQFTFPIGGTGRLVANEKEVVFEIVTH
ncbi:MAG: LD-carboxypeptidase [Chloroflexota bacterium]